MKLAASVLRKAITDFKDAISIFHRMYVAYQFMSKNAEIVLEEIENHQCKEE